jgi:signal transduction histidine kinase
VSIRRRLLLIVALSGVVLTGAVFSIVRLVQSSDAARVEAAESMVEDVAQAIDRSDDVHAFQRSVGAALSGARRVIAGACGDPIVGLRAHGRRDGARPTPLPHDHGAAIADACREAKGDLFRYRARVRGETLIIAVANSSQGRVWASTPIRVRDGGPEPWKVAAALVALATIALSLVSLDAVVALRRGASDLDKSLDALGEDLSAPIAKPRAEELARIADGLRRLAGRLVDAQNRERVLSESLAHEQRLAGLGRVAAGVAHEVRNPLAGMKLRLDLMRPEVSNELREDIDACLSEIERLDRLVRTILGGARRDPNIQQDVSVGALIHGRFPGLPREGDATLATDPDLLAQILDNLVRNAREASDNVRVVIATNEKVEIAVVDRGAGVTDSSALFEPFFTTKGEGTGLGLFISRSLAHALRGSLDYRRERDETRFVLTLPLRWSQE